MIDRADAADGAGTLALHSIGPGVGRALGWSPVVAALALWGVVVLVRRPRTAGTGPGRPVLVGRAGADAARVGARRGIALPVYPRTALTVAAGGVALAAGVGLVSIPDRGLRLASAAAVAVVAIAALATAASRARGRTGARRRVSSARRRRRGTPSSSFRRGPAPPSPTTRRACERASSAAARRLTVVVAGDPALAVARARPVVSPPRYALLSEQKAGSPSWYSAGSGRRLPG